MKISHLFITYCIFLVSCANSTSSITNYYVSKSGSDSNFGSKNEPFLTISKAASLAKAGDVVYIMGGTYRETLQPKNSGKEGKPITFKSVAGEKVIISAMESLDNWTLDSGNIYKTTVDWDLEQLNFIMRGTTALDLARWPNNTDGDRMTLNSVRNDGGSLDKVFKDAFLTDLDIPNWDWSNGGSLLFYGDRPGSGWLTWKAWIKKSSKGRIDFDALKNRKWIISFHPPGTLGDYYLEGIKESLDYENEWYFDKKDKTLHVQLPNGVKPKDGEVQMRKRVMTIDLEDNEHIKIKGIAVFGGSIEMGSYCKLSQITSLYGSMTRGISLEHNSGVNAIKIAKDKKFNVIEKCEVGFGDGSGIWDSGYGTIVDNCYVHDFDFLGAYDAPMMMKGVGSGKLINSTITRGGRDALQLSAKNMEVAYNDFSYSNKIADDCGLIYTIGSDIRLDLHHNWFHDAESRGKLKKAAGIYLDSSNDSEPNPEKISVHHNVVWNVEWTNIQINWNGTDINVFNNTLMKAEGGTMGAWHREGTAFKNVKVWNNITDEKASDSGDNQETEVTWETQADRQNNLIDKNAFVDYDNNDFRLKADASAIDTGRIINVPILGPESDIFDYTKGFTGKAPDVGAYEYGKDWNPGIDWDIKKGPNNMCYGLPGEACNKQ